jgi:hypothetical protein
LIRDLPPLYRRPHRGEFHGVAKPEEKPRRLTQRLDTVQTMILRALSRGPCRGDSSGPAPLHDRALMSLKATHTQRLGTSTPPMSLSPTLFLPLSLCASLSPSIYHPSSLLERPPPRQRNAIVIAPAPALLRRSPPRRLLMTRDTPHATHDTRLDARHTSHNTQHTPKNRRPMTNAARTPFEPMHSCCISRICYITVVAVPGI